MEQQMTSIADSPSEDVLTQIAALRARLDEQAATIAEQQRKIAQLEDAVVASVVRAPSGQSAVETRTSRRGMLTKMLAATAAAAVLTVAREAATAEANTRTSVIGASVAQYGLAAASNNVTSDPVGLLTNLGPKWVGVIGVSANPGYEIPFDCGVLGQGYYNYGICGLSSAAVGVHGQSTTGIGIFGYSQSQIGVRGDSANNYGVYGTSPLTALRGEATGAGVGFVGIAGPAPGGKAGFFLGDVVVQGNFTVASGAKSAAVRHPDGSHRRVYCQESTEAWFEDFGTATLTNGHAVIDLDPDFDAVVKGDDFLVFTMPEGDCNGLFVSRKGPHRFVVDELKGGKSNLPFCYRIVSRRREYVGTRLQKVDMSGPPTPKSSPQPVGPSGRLTAPAHADGGR